MVLVSHQRRAVAAMFATRPSSRWIVLSGVLDQAVRARAAALTRRSRVRGKRVAARSRAPRRVPPTPRDGRRSPLPPLARAGTRSPTRQLRSKRSSPESASPRSGGRRAVRVRGRAAQGLSSPSSNAGRSTRRRRAEDLAAATRPSASEGRGRDPAPSGEAPPPRHLQPVLRAMATRRRTALRGASVTGQTTTANSP